MPPGRAWQGMSHLQGTTQAASPGPSMRCTTLTQQAQIMHHRHPEGRYGHCPAGALACMTQPNSSPVASASFPPSSPMPPPWHIAHSIHRSWMQLDHQ